MEEETEGGCNGERWWSRGMGSVGIKYRNTERQTYSVN
jgi:hypothetical protein